MSLVEGGGSESGRGGERERRGERRRGEGEKERLSHIITFDIENISYVFYALDLYLLKCDS